MFESADNRTEGPTIPARISAPQPGGPTADGLHIGLLIALVVVTYWPARQGEFLMWDDDVDLVSNLRFRGFGWSNIDWMFTTVHNSTYRPVAWFTYALDHALWGMDSKGYHRTNLVLHALAVALFYLLSKRLLVLSGGSAAAPRWPVTAGAGLAAALFAVHPTRVEVVAWIAARSHLLCGLFVILGLVFYLRRSGPGATADAPRFPVLSFAAFLAALICNPIAIGVPFVLVVLDVYPLRRLGGRAGWRSATARRLLMHKVPFLILAVLGAVMARIARADKLDMEYRFAEKLNVPELLVQAASACWFYIRISLVPTELTPLHAPPPTFDPLAVRSLIVWGGVVVTTVLLVVVRRRWPAGLAVWVCFLILIGPVLGIGENVRHHDCERYSYLSCLGFAVLAGAGLTRVWRAAAERRLPRAWCAATLGLAVGSVAALGSLARLQTHVWHDSLALFNHMLPILRGSPWRAPIHERMGIVLNEQGRPGEAIEHFKAAIAIRPDNPETHHFLGRVLNDEGHITKAMQHYHELIERAPREARPHNQLGTLYEERGELSRAEHHYRQAVRLRPNKEVYLYNLATVLLRQRKLSEAEENYRRLLGLNPDHAEGLNNLGLTLIEMKRAAEAVAFLRRALAADPRLPEPYLNLATALAAAGGADGEARAVELLRTGLSRCPDDAGLLVRLAWMLATSPDARIRDGAEALRLARRANELTHERDHQALDALGAAQAETGEHAAASATAARAAQMAAGRGLSTLAEEIRQRARLYATGRAFRQTPAN